ncbi:hypothetical protein D9757_006938 [Collybiopsis confluens]|uniref:Uncharacterized protein n=1 Tax=Collybiopsis confluens TaxID=2823264 RepID=A0A8H5HIY9_9AGAR|nr:hypothetical protein D9757_006938 [Collybiopsis confluens]
MTLTMKQAIDQSSPIATVTLIGVVMWAAQTFSCLLGRRLRRQPVDSEKTEYNNDPATTR